MLWETLHIVLYAKCVNKSKSEFKEMNNLTLTKEVFVLNNAYILCLYLDLYMITFNNFMGWGNWNIDYKLFEISIFRTVFGTKVSVFDPKNYIL